MRVAQRCIHRLQPGVAVGPIHLRVKARRERHRVAEVRQPEIRRIRLPVHYQVAQCALVVAGGVENPRNLFEAA